MQAFLNVPGRHCVQVAIRLLTRRALRPAHCDQIQPHEKPFSMQMPCTAILICYGKFKQN
ncbi:hypothetical protein ASD94_03930 [Acidovorax sp. Root70]|nr:hypothetical protein ASD94_03930 [Acidovorax sp. Root70]